MKKLSIVLVRCPQPLLIGKETRGLYSPNRSLTPEPTLPQLHGIIRHYDPEIEVIQLDLRDPCVGTVQEVEYGLLNLPYLEEALSKTYNGVAIEQVRDQLEAADIVGFTCNFSMSRGVIVRHIAQVRKLFPKKEIWIGGRDIFTRRVIDVYAQAAGRKNLVVFHGHVFRSLPKYLEWRMNKRGRPIGVSIYDEEGNVSDMEAEVLNQDGQVVHMPLPVYVRPESLGYFTGSGEGTPDQPFGRFVHATFSVGCPYACGYCTTGYRERYLVHKDLASIGKELDMYKKMGVTTLAIMDDNFLALGPAKVQEIMELVNSYRFDIEYGNGLQLQLLAKYWDKIAEDVLGSCLSLYAPLEDLTRNRLYEKLDPIKNQLELIMRIVREKPGALRYLTMGVVHGVPGHTKRQLETTFLKNVEKFLSVFQGSELKVAATIFNFIPLSGTKFGEEAFNSGRIVVEDPFLKDPEVLSFGTVSYAPEGMTHREVFEIYERALNMNPAGRQFGVPYVALQRLGEQALPSEQRNKMPRNWRKPGYHLREKVI